MGSALPVNSIGYSRTSDVEQASVRFHALSFIGSPYLISTSRLREPIGKNESRNKKMEKKEKKFYESPTMTVYEIGRTQILAGSANGGTQPIDREEDYTW